MKNQPVLERFFDKVDLDEVTGCWNFTSSIGKTNCGRFYYNYKCMDAYKIGYVLMGGEIPKGYDLHHTCENRRCVNPKHLQPVTRVVHVAELSTNSIAYKNKQKTSCPKGHPYTEDNIVKGLKSRHCRLCAVKRSGDFRKEKRKKDIANGAKPYKRNKFEPEDILEMQKSTHDLKEIIKKFNVSYGYLYTIRRAYRQTVSE